MKIKFYASSVDGRCLGDFEGSIPQEPHVEVNHRPEHGGATWDTASSSWVLDIPTNLRLWQESMVKSDTTMITRSLEDHITSDHGGVTESASLQSKYDQKITLRESLI